MIFFLYLIKNNHCGYSSEVPQQPSPGQKGVKCEECKYTKICTQRWLISTSSDKALFPTEKNCYFPYFSSTKTCFYLCICYMPRRLFLMIHHSKCLVFQKGVVLFFCCFFLFFWLLRLRTTGPVQISTKIYYDYIFFFGKHSQITPNLTFWPLKRLRRQKFTFCFRQCSISRTIS